MRDAVLLAIACAILCVACSGGVSVAKFEGIYPGMACGDLDNYLKREKVVFKKDGDEYKFDLKDKAWRGAGVRCDNVVTKLEFASKKGSTAKEARAYIDAQTSLLNAFRGNRITYEEGNKTINLNNGIKLHQFPDPGSGTITHFKVSVDDVRGSKDAWAAAAPLLPGVGGE